MYSKQVYKNLIYLLTLYGTSFSSPIDTGIQALKKNDATLSGYRALSPPIWPYTPPMKPTRPYAFESNFDMSKTCQISIIQNVKLMWVHNVKLTWIQNVKLVWIQNLKLS